jgi:hypothetical protein
MSPLLLTASIAVAGAAVAIAVLAVSGEGCRGLEHFNGNGNGNGNGKGKSNRKSNRKSTSLDSETARTMLTVVPGDANFCPGSKQPTTFWADEGARKKDWARSSLADGERCSDAAVPQGPPLQGGVAVPTCPFKAAAPEKRDLPPPPGWLAAKGDTDRLGTRIGPIWRLVVGPPDVPGTCFFPPEVTALIISRGMASWSDEDGVLTWRPKWLLPKKGPKDSGDWRDVTYLSCVWRTFEPVRLTGDGAVLRTLFRTQVKGGNPDMDFWAAGEEGATSLRNPGGTGDFRVTLWKTDGGEDPAKWQGYQVRIYPLMHVMAYISGHEGSGDNSNASSGYRSRMGYAGCMTEDCCQEHEEKSMGGRSFKSQDNVAMGPHSPPCEWIEVIIRLKMADDKRMHPEVSINGNNMAFGDFDYDNDKTLEGNFDRVDAISWGFNNARPYHNIQLWCDNF